MEILAFQSNDSDGEDFPRLFPKPMLVIRNRRATWLNNESPQRLLYINNQHKLVFNVYIHLG